MTIEVRAANKAVSRARAKKAKVVEAIVMLDTLEAAALKPLEDDLSEAKAKLAALDARLAELNARKAARAR